MTPPTEPPPKSSEDPRGSSDRDALVDLLASCALDDVEADRADLDAADAAGITSAEVERRRSKFAAVRSGLLDEAVPIDGAIEPDDGIAERRHERAIAAAVAVGVRPPKQRLDAPVPTRRTPRRRLAPVLVAAGVLAVAGVGALVVSTGEDMDDSASSGAGVQLDAATEGSDEAATTAVDPAEAESADSPAADELDESAAVDSLAAAPNPTVLDLGPLDSLSLAFDAVSGDGASSRQGTRAEIEADTACVVQMAIEGYRAVAAVRVGTTTHLVGEMSSGELAAFRTSDCTVVARRPG